MCAMAVEGDCRVSSTEVLAALFRDAKKAAEKHRELLTAWIESRAGRLDIELSEPSPRLPRKPPKRAGPASVNRMRCMPAEAWVTGTVP